MGGRDREAVAAMRADGNIAALARPLGVTLTAVSQHLAILEAGGLAKTHKEGRVRTCRMGAAGFAALEQWIAQHRRTWERRLDALGDVLGEDD